MCGGQQKSQGRWDLGELDKHGKLLSGRLILWFHLDGLGSILMALVRLD